MYFLKEYLLKLVILLFLIDRVYNRTAKIKTLMYTQKTKNKLLNHEHVTQFQNVHYFQDIFSEHLSPLEIMFGHVCENPKKWEQRYERRNINDGIYQGKIRWGNKNGQYEEHYWDLNHRRK